MFLFFFFDLYVLTLYVMMLFLNFYLFSFWLYWVFIAVWAISVVQGLLCSCCVQASLVAEHMRLGHAAFGL